VHTLSVSGVSGVALRGHDGMAEGLGVVAVWVSAVAHGVEMVICWAGSRSACVWLGVNTASVAKSGEAVDKFSFFLFIKKEYSHDNH
jgi:hypothetical protein